jgi:type I restriction enzyme S subunit
MKLPRYPKYKDSGVKWLGEVPEHWEIKRLKRCVRLVTMRASEQSNPIALENIESWTGKYVAGDGSYDGEGIAFEKGDILFGKLRPYLAKAYLATGPGEAVGDFFVMRPNMEAQGSFLQSFLLTKNLIDMIDGSTFGAKMPRASWDFLGAIPIPLPRPEEQNAIYRFYMMKFERSTHWWSSNAC